MKTLEETIKYYIHIENNLREKIKEEQNKKEESVFCEKEIAEFLNTADAYKQLVEWLTELKNRREVSEIEKRSIEKCDKCSDIFDCPLYYPWLKE